MSGFRDFYTYDLAHVVDLIRREGARKVLIQLPDGVKQFSTEILDELRDRVRDTEFVVDANPVYGPCVLNTHVARYYDLVLHFGHDPYPYRWECDVRVAFVELLSTLSVGSELLKELADTLRSMSLREVALYTVQQHKHVIHDAVRALVRYGVRVVNSDNLTQAVILGCWLSDAFKYVDVCRGYVVISGGRFHPLGLGLHLGGMRSVVQLDPYRSEVRVVDSDVRRYLRVRYGKLMKALESRSWYLTHGIDGQYRRWVRDKLVAEARARGVKVYEAQTHVVNRDILRNIDSVDVDTYVVTSCPRLPVDDLVDFEKPVLTPGEAFMVLTRRLDSYVFPW